MQNRFVTKDIATEPPTTVLISLDAEDVTLEGDTFVVPAKFVEPTAGWTNRQGKALTICVMHSFGKCSGRDSSDPSSCQQIHLKLEVLAKIRKDYTFPTREFFSRTVKARIDDNLRQLISQVLRRPVPSLQYLEYRSKDVLATSGSRHYERKFRDWLHSPSGPASFSVDSCFQCNSFATQGECPEGEKCENIHANMMQALSRDRGVMSAIEHISRSQQNQRLQAPMSLALPPGTAQFLPTSHSQAIYHVNMPSMHMMQLPPQPFIVHHEPRIQWQPHHQMFAQPAQPQQVFMYEPALGGTQQLYAPPQFPQLPQQQPQQQQQQQNPAGLWPF